MATLEELTASMTVVDAARVTLADRLRRVRKLLKRLATNWPPDAEDIHQLRVGSRRATAALRLYRFLLPKEDRRWWRAKLRTWRRGAGRSRNLDVLIPFLELWEFREGCRRRKCHPSILDVVRVQQCHARLELRDLIANVSMPKFRRREKRLLRALSASADADSSATLSDWAPRQLRPVHEQFLGEAPHGEADAVALHRFRIAGKRLRYTLELLAVTLPASTSTHALERISELQTQLGKLNDFATQIQLLKSIFPQEPGDHARSAAEMAPWPTTDDSVSKGGQEKKRPSIDRQDIEGLIQTLELSEQLERCSFLNWWKANGPEICRMLEESQGSRPGIPADHP